MTAAATALLTCAIPAMAQARHSRDASRPTGATLLATFHDPGASNFTNEHLDCPDTSRGGCAFAFDGTTTETGDLAGSTTYHGWLYRGDAIDRTFRWEVVEKFTGKITGCGKGSLQWTGSGYGDLTSFDPTSQSARMRGHLTIINGSGTGGLRGAAGTLTVDAAAHAVPTGAQDGTFSGRLTCGG